eukprot:5363489-Pyramimonas_sp.AAC.3
MLGDRCLALPKAALREYWAANSSRERRIPQGGGEFLKGAVNSSRGRGLRVPQGSGEFLKGAVNS